MRRCASGAVQLSLRLALQGQGKRPVTGALFSILPASTRRPFTLQVMKILSGRFHRREATGDAR